METAGLGQRRQLVAVSDLEAEVAVITGAGAGLAGPFPGNSFAQPTTVVPKPYSGRVRGNVVTLDVPPANTYTYEMMGQLDAAILRARMDEAVHVIMLVGAGEIDTVVLAFTDMQGRLQGKRLTANHFLEEVAENVAESLGKGSRVMVAGRLEQRSWDTQDGEKPKISLGVKQLDKRLQAAGFGVVVLQPLQVRANLRRVLVATIAILLQALHDDPVEVT